MLLGSIPTPIPVCILVVGAKLLPPFPPVSVDPVPKLFSNVIRLSISFLTSCEIGASYVSKFSKKLSNP